MPTPEEKYYDGMNTLLTPVRAAKSLMQTVLIILLLLGIGLFYPIIQLCNGEPLTLFSFVVPALTLLVLFTFFYTPYYTLFAVFVGGFTIAAIAANTDISKYGVCFLIFAFLAVGILQRYVRHRLFDPPKEPKPKRLSLGEQISQIHLESCTRKYDAMSPKDREDMTRLFGDNYLTWPEREE
jgi:hypothetical protein